SREEDRRAQDFFSYAVGMSLYLQGSRSPYLRKGMEQLEEVANRYADSDLGAKAALVLASSLVKPFHRIEKPTFAIVPDRKILNAPSTAASAPPSGKVKGEVVKPDPEAALRWTEKALAQVKAEPKGGSHRDSNLLYSHVVAQRAALFEKLDRKDDARQEVE